MIAGVQPFKALTSYLSMEKTKKAEYTIPLGFDHVARDLVANFLIVDPSQRLGDAARGGPEPIRTHKFFESVSWSHIWNLDPPPLEAGLVKKEPPPPRRDRSQDPVIVDDHSSDDNSDDLDASDGSERGEAWAALVRDLSEDEMEDGRSASYNHRRSDAYSLGGGSEGTLGDSGSGRREVRNRSGAPPMRMIFPRRDESVSVERSERTVRGSGWSKSNSPSRNEPSTQISPERGHTSETGASTSGQAGGEVHAWDAHYTGQPTSLSGDDETRLSLSREINESRVNGGSPVSSEATSSTGRSDGQAIWYVSQIACILPDARFLSLGVSGAQDPPAESWRKGYVLLGGSPQAPWNFPRTSTTKAAAAYPHRPSETTLCKDICAYLVACRGNP